MNIMTLINALPGAVAQGLIWGIMAIGVYLTFRILDFADLTVDGSMCTGGAVCIMMMQAGFGVWPSMLAATGAGMLTGLATGIFHTCMGIPAILSGILTQLSLYSVNLKIMGKANRRTVLVLRHRAWLCDPRNRLQQQHVPRTGHQHQLQ